MAGAGQKGGYVYTLFLSPPLPRCSTAFSHVAGSRPSPQFEPGFANGSVGMVVRGRGSGGVQAPRKGESVALEFPASRP